MRFANVIDGALSTLPWNGDKAKIGGWTIVSSLLSYLVPGLSSATLSNPYVLGVGVAVFVAGKVHDAAKNYLRDNAPELLTVSSAQTVAAPDVSKTAMPLAIFPERRPDKVKK